MTFYKLLFQKSAKKFMLKNKKEGLKFYQAFLEIAEDRQNFSKYDIKILRGYKNSYRLRIGKNRALFKIVNEKIVIIVIDIGSRGDIYK